MMTRWVPKPSDKCKATVRDKSKIFEEFYRQCGLPAVVVVNPSSSVRVQLCSRHAAELLGHLADAMHERISPDPDYPPGTELPGC